jgi:hypothetical protein
MSQQLEHFERWDDLDAFADEAAHGALEGGAFDALEDGFVFAPDQRFQVCRSGCTRSPAQFPFNTVCRIQGPGGGFGSGCLIAPQVVLTAKHVLTSGGVFSCGTLTGNWTPHAVSIAVGRDGATTTGRPAVQNVPVTRIRTHPTLDPRASSMGGGLAGTGAPLVEARRRATQRILARRGSRACPALFTSANNRATREKRARVQAAGPCRISPAPLWRRLAPTRIRR